MNMPSDQFFVQQAILNLHGKAWMRAVANLDHLWPSELYYIRAEVKRLREAQAQ